MAQRKPSHQPPKPSKIPEFSSIEEESEFWDTHDITEFLDETVPVRIQTRDPLERVLAVRLDAGEQDALTRLAKAQGISPSALVHLWIKEQISKKSA
jgi:hypothetical protein